MTKPITHGVVLVAGGAIGGGMFALPIVSAGAGYLWAVLGLGLVWFFTYQASLMLLKVNLDFKTGASFSSIVEGSLGSNWARLNNLSIAFIMYVLMYAYATAGASILSHTLDNLGSASFDISRPKLSLVFTAIVAVLVWAGSTLVSRASAVLLIGMALLLLAVLFDLTGLLNINNLTPHLAGLPYVGGAIPVFVTAMACGGLVPSLVKHYDADAAVIRRCLLYGTVLSLIVYLLWLLLTLGALSKADYQVVIANGANTGDLVNGLIQVGASSSLNRSLTLFSHMAIITSFLSIGLGLFDFVLDRFKLSEGLAGKSCAALICFVPPAVMSYLFPYGFVRAIAYAGLAVSFSFFLIPALMVVKRDRTMVLSGNAVSHYKHAVVLFTIAIVLLKILSELGVLPKFG